MLVPILSTNSKIVTSTASVRSQAEPAGKKIKVLRRVAEARTEVGTRFNGSVPRKGSKCLITLGRRLDGSGHGPSARVVSS